MPDAPIPATAARVIAATPEALFDAFLDPATARRFLFSATGGEVVRAEIDPRVGGRFLIVDRRGEADVPHEGEFLELDRPRRLAFRFHAGEEPTWTRVVVEIAPAGDRSRVAVTHELAPAYADFVARAEGAWAMMLGKLAAAVEG